MATYNPYQRGTVGQMAFTGQLQGIRQQALDLEAIEDYISGSSKKLQEATSSSSKSGALSRFLGFAAGKGAQSLLKMAFPKALLVGAAVSGLSRFLGGRKVKKQTKNIGSNAPQVLYGKKQLRRAQSEIDRNVAAFQDAPLPQALSSAFQTVEDLFKLESLQSILAKEAGGEIAKTAGSELFGKGQIQNDPYLKNLYSMLQGSRNSGFTNYTSNPSTSSPYGYMR